MQLTHLELVNHLLTKANIDDIKGISTTGAGTLADPYKLSGNPSYVTKASRALSMASEVLTMLREWNFLLRRGDTRATTASSRDVVLADSAIGYHPNRTPKRVYRTTPGYYPIIEVGDAEWEGRIGKTTASAGHATGYKLSGIGTLGTLQGRTLQLDPVLSTSYNIFVDHFQLPAKMVLETATTVWPDYALVLEASIIYFNIRGRKAEEIRKERDFHLLSLIRADGSTPRSRKGMGPPVGAIVPPQLPSSVNWG